MLIQKSRLKWLKEGDRNSGFFHRTIQGSRRSNEIHGLWIDGKFYDGVQELKEEVKNYFERQFKEETWSRPTLQGLAFKSLDEGDNVF